MECKKLGCIYCEENGALNELMEKISELKYSKLYLFRDQKHVGRCVVAYKDHVNELFHIPIDEFQGYMEEVRYIANIIKDSFNADKINYAVYGDIVSHVHFHIVPKYKEGIQWGEAFNDKDEKVYKSDHEFKEIKNRILSRIEGEVIV